MHRVGIPAGCLVHRMLCTIPTKCFLSPLRRENQPGAGYFGDFKGDSVRSCGQFRLVPNRGLWMRQ